MTGQQIIADVMQRQMVGPKEFFGVAQAAHFVKARRIAIKSLSEAGFNPYSIARLMRRDISTVMYWLRPDLRSRRIKYDAAKRSSLRAAVSNPTIRTPTSFQVQQ